MNAAMHCRQTPVAYDEAWNSLATAQRWRCIYFAGQDDVNNAASIVLYNIQRVSAHGRRRRDVLVLSREFGLARSGTVSFVRRIRCRNRRQVVNVTGNDFRIIFYRVHLCLKHVERRVGSSPS